MTFEPGDKVRHKDNHNRTGLEVLAVRGDRFWGLPPSGNGPLTYRTEDYEKIEPFFEVGKAYRRWGSNTVFRPIRVDKGSAGGLYAYGSLTLTGPRRDEIVSYGAFTGISYGEWTEEAGDIPFEG